MTLHPSNRWRIYLANDFCFWWLVVPMTVAILDLGRLPFIRADEGTGMALCLKFCLASSAYLETCTRYLKCFHCVDSMSRLCLVLLTTRWAEAMACVAYYEMRWQMTTATSTPMVQRGQLAASAGLMPLDCQWCQVQSAVILPFCPSRLVLAFPIRISLT